MLTGAKKVFTLLYPTVLYDVKSQSASAAALAFCCLVTLAKPQRYQNTSHIKTKQFPLKTGYYLQWPAMMEVDYLIVK